MNLPLLHQNEVLTQMASNESSCWKGFHLLITGIKRTVGYGAKPTKSADRNCFSAFFDKQMSEKRMKKCGRDAGRGLAGDE